MRSAAILAILCSLAAFILSFLCLFAGNKKGFLEDYHLLTLNTSSIGQGFVNDLITSDSDNPISDIWNQISEPLQDAAEDGLEYVASRLGLQDFYSAHLMTYCEGTYIPNARANETVELSDIHKNISNCSTAQALFHFDPRASLQQSLNESGVDITLEDLDWPQAIDDAVKTIESAYAAIFVLYCISIAVIFLSLLASIAGIFTEKRLISIVNVFFAGLGFLAIMIASAIVTAVIQIAGNAINKNGEAISIEAQKGTKFMALTWATTGLMFVSMTAWTVAFIIGRKRQRQTYNDKMALHG